MKNNIPRVLVISGICLCVFQAVSLMGRDGFPIIIPEFSFNPLKSLISLIFSSPFSILVGFFVQDIFEGFRFSYGGYNGFFIAAITGLILIAVGSAKMKKQDRFNPRRDVKCSICGSVFPKGTTPCTVCGEKLKTE